ncbi:MAG: M23 family metallopeptidase [Caldilinea sp.]|nr:M23 family metallopeptidase [Caldilinea sp.]
MALSPKPILPINAVRIIAAMIVVAVGAWVVWTRSVANDSRPAREIIADEQAPISEPGTILGLRPTFTPTPASPATPLPVIDAGELAQIVIVTPTPDPRRALTVGGAIVDRPFAVANTERSSAGLMSLFSIGANLPPAPQMVVDLSDLRIPPMVEEIIEAPPPQVKIVTIDGVELAPPEPATPTPAPDVAPEPTAVRSIIPPLVNNGPTRVWSSFQPKPPEENDHFWVESPFVNTEYNRVAAPSYQFGSTAGGQYRPHHGLDIANRWGTPVQAGATGTVVFAGLDDPIPMGPYPNFYGNTVVIQLDRKLPVAGGEIDAFVLYGHLSRVTVAQGQRVEPNDIVGEVGMTGIAIGPHLHVEMRVGENTYQNSVNPYLWLKPAPGEGVVAVRLVTADGRSWPGARLTLARFENGRAVWGRLIETYLDNENIIPNPSWGENGAMGDVPAGYYVLIGNVNGEAVRAEFFVREGQTTFVEIRTKQ